MRMCPESFEYLLQLVGPVIVKQNTKMREPISAAERLTMTVHYLAYGESQQSLSFSYRMGASTVSMIVYETCTAIWEALHSIYLRPPSCSADWKRIAEDFYNQWNLPHCVRAIDGKHVAIKCPLSSGSLYFNYKGYFSLVLMAICDARYTFTLVDIGDYGSNNDSGVFRNSEMGKSFLSESMNLPEPEPLQNSSDQSPVPYFLVGDEAFALKPWLLRPYSGHGLPEAEKVFNYRLSRARRVIENSFGILAARWQIFHSVIQTSVKTAEVIIQATVCLHNYLRQTNSAGYCPAGFVDCENATGEIKPGEWRRLTVPVESSGALRPIANVRGSRYLNAAVDVREKLKQYVNSSEGTVPWQLNHIRSRRPILQ